MMIIYVWQYFLYIPCELRPQWLQLGTAALLFSRHSSLWSTRMYIYVIWVNRQRVLSGDMSHKQPHEALPRFFWIFCDGAPLSCRCLLCTPGRITLHLFPPKLARGMCHLAYRVRKQKMSVEQGFSPLSSRWFPPVITPPLCTLVLTPKPSIHFISESREDLKPANSSFFE